MADEMEPQDPEITAAVDRAVRALGGKLAGWATGMQDPHRFAEEFIAALRAEGWRPPLKPAPEWHPARRPPPGAPTEEYQEARKAHPTTKEP